MELWQQRIYWAAFGAQAFSPKIYSPLLCSVYTVATVSACKASLMNKHGGQSQLFALTTTSNHMHIHEMASMQIILLRLQIITPPPGVCVCTFQQIKWGGCDCIRYSQQTAGDSVTDVALVSDLHGSKNDSEDGRKKKREAGFTLSPSFFLFYVVPATVEYDTQKQSILWGKS